MHLPVGTSNFGKLIDYKDPNGIGYLFVDKTLFIKEIIYDLTEVIVLTRPRRFGKTLNLSMLQHFWAKDVEGKTTEGLFNGLKISKDQSCMDQQGKYPVIFITFKDIKQPSIELALKKIAVVMAETYRKHRKIFDSSNMNKDDINYVSDILEQKTNQANLESSIKRLIEILHKCYGKKPILLIDEYDTPIQESYIKGYYDELVEFFRNFLSAPLKDEDNLERAILTGILRVSKESLFSGLNNAKTYSILHQKYSSYFGFTVEETNELLVKANLPDTDNSLAKEWYNGYNFGGVTIYNPWSIINFIKDHGRLAPYWIHTSNNELIRELLITSEVETQEKIGQLITGGEVKEIVDENIVFRDLEKNRAAIWGLFTMCGYLKVLSSEFSEFGNICTLAIPNKEVEFLYKQIFREWLSGNRGIIWYQELLTVLTTGKIPEFERKLQNAIEEMASYHDTSKTTQEIFYQGLMLGILVGLKDQYEIRSNREAGVGRYDLLLSPKDPTKLGIIMEFKAIDNKLKLEEEAIAALAQIKKSKYATDLKSRDIKNICSMGIAFAGKSVKVASDHS